MPPISDIMCISIQSIYTEFCDQGGCMNIKYNHQTKDLTIEISPWTIAVLIGSLLSAFATYYL